MQVAGVQQASADGLPGAALEEEVVGQDDGGAAVGVEDGVDVLDEVQLLVGRVGPEVLPGDKHLLALGATFGRDDKGRGFRPNGGFAKHIDHRMPGSAFEFQPPPLKEGPARRVRRELALSAAPAHT